MPSTGRQGRPWPFASFLRFIVLPPSMSLMFEREAMAALGPRLPRSGSPHRSAYWGAPAAHTARPGVVGAAESDPEQTFAYSTLIAGRFLITGRFEIMSDGRRDLGTAPHCLINLRWRLGSTRRWVRFRPRQIE